MFVLRGQDLTDPLAEMRRRFSKVHRDIEHRSLDDPHQPSLWLFDLVMEPAQRALPGMAEVFLHKLYINATVGKIARLSGFHKETTRILMYGGDFSDDAGQSGGLERHWRTASLKSMRQTPFVNFQLGFTHKPARTMICRGLRNCAA